MAAASPPKPLCKHLLKTVIYGDAKVGKTSLVNRFCRHSFTANYVPTIGVEIGRKVLQIDDESCAVQFWDPNVTMMLDPIIYLRGASAVMVVYDAQNYSTFNNVTFWLNRIRASEFGNSLTVVLVANKVDGEPNTKCVSYKQGNHLARDLKVDFFIEVCAKSGENVQEAFVTMLALCIEKRRQR